MHGAGTRLQTKLTHLVRGGDVGRVAMGRLIRRISVGHSAFCLRCASVCRVLRSVRTRLVRRVARLITSCPLSPLGGGRDSCPFVRRVFAVLSRGGSVYVTLLKGGKSVTFIGHVRGLVTSAILRHLSVHLPGSGHSVRCTCTFYLGKYIKVVGA